VFPERIGPDAYLEIRIVTSWRPTRAGRAAGAYIVEYRLGGPDAPGTYAASGLVGAVTLPAVAGEWNSIQLDPLADIGALWPDVDGRDASLYDLFLGAASRNRTPAAGCFDFLRFARSTQGDAPLERQAELMAAYAPKFPTVTQHPALEVSLHKDHVNTFGGSRTLPDYSPLPILPTLTDGAATRELIAAAHRNGGLASFNHSFGSGGGTLSESQQDARMRALATSLLSERAFGVDILEVGYRKAAGITLSRHLAAWDVCSRNALFLTGNGVSDDHSGKNWRTGTKNFLTWAWAPTTSEPDLLAALAAGRAFFGDLARFAGTIDLRVDGACPMGSVSLFRRPNAGRHRDRDGHPRRRHDPPAPDRRRLRVPGRAARLRPGHDAARRRLRDRSGDRHLRQFAVVVRARGGVRQRRPGGCAVQSGVAAADLAPGGRPRSPGVLSPARPARLPGFEQDGPHGGVVGGAVGRRRQRPVGAGRLGGGVVHRQRGDPAPAGAVGPRAHGLARRRRPRRRR
jgi:hypothetical protein